MREAEREWARHVRAWRASGETASEYCEDRGLKLGSLRYWSTRLGRDLGPVEDESDGVGGGLRLARVEVGDGSVRGSGVRMRVGTITVELERGFDLVTLQQVVEALHAAAGENTEGER